MTQFHLLQSWVEQQWESEPRTSIHLSAMPSTMSCFCDCDLSIIMDRSLGQSARINDSFLKFLFSEHFITVTSELLSNQIWSLSSLILLHLKPLKFQKPPKALLCISKCLRLPYFPFFVFAAPKYIFMPMPCLSS